MFYCNATEVIDTRINDKPITLILMTGSKNRMVVLSVPPNPTNYYLIW